MVEIPFTVLITFVIISFFMIVFGLFTRRMFGIYYMGTIIIVLTGVIWITMFAQIDTVSGIDSNFNSTTSSIPVIIDHMNQQTSNTIINLRSGGITFVGQELVNDNSVLNMKEVNQITVRLDKDGMPTSYIYFGVWNAIVKPTSTNYKFLIGQSIANNTDLTGATYTITRNDTKTYTLQVNDAIGIFFDGGSVGNSINIYQNSTTSSFDGANTYRTQYNDGWQDSSPSDVRGKISLVTNNIQELNNSDKYDFNSVVKIYLVFFGVIIILTGGIYQLNGQRDKR